MAAELRRTHEEQIAGRNRDAFAALEWLASRGGYIEVEHKDRSRGHGSYIALDAEAGDGSFEAVILNPDRSRHVERRLTLLGAIEWLQERLK